MFLGFEVLVVGPCPKNPEKQRPTAYCGVGMSFRRPNWMISTSSSTSDVQWMTYEKISNSQGDFQSNEKLHSSHDGYSGHRPGEHGTCTNSTIRKALLEVHGIIQPGRNGNFKTMRKGFLGCEVLLVGPERSEKPRGKVYCGLGIAFERPSWMAFGGPASSESLTEKLLPSYSEAACHQADDKPIEYDNNPEALIEIMISVDPDDGVTSLVVR
jgi:hypothetical protein